jgi:hypothetical protein
MMDNLIPKPEFANEVDGAYLLRVFTYILQLVGYAVALGTVLKLQGNITQVIAAAIEQQSTNVVETEHREQD